MIDPFELYEELCGSVNTQQGGHVRPERNFQQWINAIQLSIYEEKFAAYGKSQKVIDDLSRPFLKSINLRVVNGVAAFPQDYGHFSSARMYTFAGSDETVGLPEKQTYDECGKPLEDPDGLPESVREAIESEQQASMPAVEPAAPVKLIETTIDLIGNERWGSVTRHRFLAPTMENPKMTQFDGGYKVAPAGVTMIVLDYLRMPSPAVLAYSVAPPDLLTGRGEYLIYDKAQSKPLEWSALVRNEFLIRLDKKYGKYIREDFIWQVSESDRKTTM